jgi:hypothetical protein
MANREFGPRQQTSDAILGQLSSLEHGSAGREAERLYSRRERLEAAGHIVFVIGEHIFCFLHWHYHDDLQGD